ncbi:MAG: uracil-DNA glycosylase [Bdellovibrionaceae bacterium]|nr:uracil-DNA glycosylase [Bdellovibrio sp.]
MAEIKLHASWLKYLKNEFEADYMLQLKKFLKTQYDAGKIIYPKTAEYFNALDHTYLNNVKVVLLGQDPYHGPGQAHGLCFSVKDGVRFPPSLKNIFKELKNDLAVKIPESGELTRWADQGVLLLNSVLTVEAGQAGSHQNKGWEKFTDKVIEVVNEHCDHVVFILWGAYAQKKASFVDRKKHLVLESVHPSPLSSHRGFFGSKPFSQTNSFLKKQGVKEIQW